MKEILPNIFAVEVQKESYYFRYKKIKNELWYRDPKYPGQRIAHYVRKESLLRGSYEILFTTKDCTEEQAATLPMEDSGKNFGYKDYEGKQSSHFYADHALLSLLRSHSLDPKNKNYLLLKKIS